MASLYRISKATYKRLFPRRVRDAVYHATPLVLKRARGRLIQRLERGASHNEIYDAEYYAKSVEPSMALSAGVMSATIVEELAPRSVLDVGCGTGGLILALTEKGVECSGLEHAQAAVDICRARGLHVQQFDLESGERCDVMADVAVSTEVAEHILPEHADHFVDVMCGAAATVILTAATPGQSGTDHVNEQPNSYWIAKFASRDYQFDDAASHSWRDRWRDNGVTDIYWKSLMLFRKNRSCT